MLSWPEGTKPPSRAHALDGVQGALDALGLDDRHRGIVVAHADTDSPYVHVLVSRVCPETGRAVKVTKPAVRRLQRWAVDYERRTGGVVIENRVRRQQARAAFHGRGGRPEGGGRSRVPRVMLQPATRSVPCAPKGRLRGGPGLCGRPATAS